MKQDQGRRVSQIVAEMTLDEKLAQMASCWSFELFEGRELSVEKMDGLLGNGIGQITRLAGSTLLEPLGVARAANQVQRYLVERTRLGIPAIFHEECCAGYLGRDGTIFPQAINLAATFEPDLAEQMAAVIRKQLRAVGAHQGLSPVLDIGRDPRWGRFEETFGEDPTLVARLGVAYVRGLQGASVRDGGVMATGKHFVGHSISQGGLNCAPVHLGPRELWEVFLGPFQAAIRDAGLHTMMNSYPELDGEVVATSRRILTGLLREKLGFQGLIVSDYEALLMIHTYHQVASDLETAAALGLGAGIECELPTRVCYGDPLKTALEKGLIDLEAVDRAVESHLQKKAELGLFENPYVDEGQVSALFSDPADRRLAGEIAAKSLVLLKNEGLFPLGKDVRSLALIGPNAASSRCFHGDYSYVAMVELGNQRPAPGSLFMDLDQQWLAEYTRRVPSLETALRAALPGAQISVTPGCDHQGTDSSGFAAAVAAAQQADVVLLALGDISGLVPACTTGETRDAADLRLPGVQQQLAEAVLALGKPTGVVLVTGRPYDLSCLVSGPNPAQAILEAWIPGQEGAAAIVAALLGEVNPGGKLPVTFPRGAGQLPTFYNQKPSGGKSNWYNDYTNAPAAPLFPFGHGLSYTRFDYDELRLSSHTAQAGETLDVQVRLTNTGQTAGDEVVQLYVRDEYARIPRPVKELRGFVRVSLEPGESKQVTFHLPVNLLAYYAEPGELVLEPGAALVMVGSSSADIRCRERFEIIGKEQAIGERLFDCPVDIQ